MAHHMTVGEYLFENFDARGDDEYLDRFSHRLDELFAAGWKLLESRKDSGYKGWWRIELFRPSLSAMHQSSTGPQR
jgi:hypothetical protein